MKKKIMSIMLALTLVFSGNLASVAADIQDEGEVIQEDNDLQTSDNPDVEAGEDISAHQEMQGSINETIFWSIDDEGCLHITGEGKIPDYTKEGDSPFANRQDISSLQIEDGIQRIGSCSFMGCSQLTEITMLGNQSMEEIGDYAFYNCPALEKFSYDGDMPYEKFGALCIGFMDAKNSEEANNEEGNSLEENDKLVFYGKRNSGLETYALNYGFPFQEISEEDSSQLEKDEAGESTEESQEKSRDEETEEEVSAGEENLLQVSNKGTSTVRLSKKTVYYTGKAVTIDEAKVTGSSGKVTYTYYTNKSCTVKTSKAKNGAAYDGAAPRFAGLYYVKARVAEDSRYNGAVSNIGKIRIRKIQPGISIRRWSRSYTTGAINKITRHFSIKPKISGKGKRSFTKVEGSNAFTVDRNTGYVTVPKGTAVGTYYIKVRINVAKSRNYLAESRTVKIRIRVHKYSLLTSALKKEVGNSLYSYVSSNIVVTIRRYQTANSYYYLTHVVTKSASQIHSGLSYGTFGGTRETPTHASKRLGWVVGINGSNFKYSNGQPDNTHATLCIKNSSIKYGIRTNGQEICLKKDGTLFSPAAGVTGLSLLKQGVTDTWSCGDTLLISNGKGVNYGIQSQQYRYPRTAIGMVKPCEYYMITAGSGNYKGGMTYTEVRSVLLEHGCTFGKCMDGGGSSALVFKNQLINTPATGSERAVADFLYFTK